MGTVATIIVLYVLVGILVSMFLEHGYRDSLVPGSEDKYLTDSLRAQFIALWPILIVKYFKAVIKYYGKDNDNNEGNTPGFGY